MMEVINGNIIGGGPSSAEQLPANNNKTTQQELDELKQQNIALLEEISKINTSLNVVDSSINRLSNRYQPHCIKTIGPNETWSVGVNEVVGLCLIAMQSGQGFQIFHHPYSTGGAMINIVNTHVTMTYENSVYTFKNNHSWGTAYVYFIPLTASN